MHPLPLDQVPLWLVFPLILGLSLAFMEAGYRLGRWRHDRVIGEKEAPVAAMSAAVLGLLAFMLAFTFSMAANRFDARRLALADEVNAIGTAYLRARLLPEPQKAIVKKQLVQYTKLRTERLTPENIQGLLDQSTAIHQELWDQAIAAAEHDQRSVMMGLFVESINEVIDLHSKRLFVGLYNRIPLTIWASLWFLIVLGMASFGYQAGIAGTTRSLEMPVFALAFAGVLYLIFDLDRSYEGLLQVSQQAMVELHSTIQSEQ